MQEENKRVLMEVNIQRQKDSWQLNLRLLEGTKPDYQLLVWEHVETSQKITLCLFLFLTFTCTVFGFYNIKLMSRNQRFQNPYLLAFFVFSISALISKSLTLTLD